MKQISIAALIIVALLGFGSKAVAQDQDKDLLTTLVDAVAEALADAVAQAVGDAVSKALADFEALDGVGSHVSAGIDTVADVGSQVTSGVEALAESRSRVSALAATITEGVSAAVARILSEFIEELRILIRTLVAIVALALVGFLAGMLIGVKRVEKLGCGFVIVFGVAVALVAGSNLGVGAGIAAAMVAGLVLPFAGTALALIAIEAGKRWLALLRSLRAGFRNLSARSSRNDKSLS